MPESEGLEVRRNSGGTPPWMGDLMERMESFVEFQSPGFLDVRCHVAECQICVAPEVLELVAGAHDGEEVFALYTVDVSRLIEEFDEVPEVTWSTMSAELWLEGSIGGDPAFISFQRDPFIDAAPPSYVIDGSLVREKRGPGAEPGT